MSDTPGNRPETTAPGAGASRVPRDAPLLVYDGECGICVRWVRYWRSLTGDKVRYAAYQDVAAAFRGIPRSAFERSIQYITLEGELIEGAHATYRVLADGGRGGWLALYRRVPGFAPLAERGYKFFSRRRGLLSAITTALWGRAPEAPRTRLVGWLLLRLIGLTYLAAFLSFSVQATGLVGADGIAPLGRYLDAVHEQLGTAAYWRMPSVFWLGHGDWALGFVCAAGVVLSALVALDVLAIPALAGAWALYLSVFYAGQVFMAFQWDLLLLEAGFLGLFLPLGWRAVIWLYRWLVFRFMLLGGLVKLQSGDPVWADLTALTYHYQTQPLPTPLAWYVHQLPEWFHRASAGATFAIELAVPFLLFLPRQIRFLGACVILAFQLSIALTGNYNFFNLLTMALCVSLFDDAAIRWMLPGPLRRRALARVPVARWPGPRAAIIGLLAVTVLGMSGMDLWQRFTRETLPAPLAAAARVVAPFRIANTYGPFAVMTTERREIVVQGSNDGTTWHDYRFRYKPGDPARAPRWIIPHQPRLDWQMWFAALGTYEHNRWFVAFVARLLQGRPEVLDLLAHDPFPGRPPTFVRAVVFDYRFTDTDERRRTGDWWRREFRGVYLPSGRLRRGDG